MTTDEGHAMEAVRALDPAPASAASRARLAPSSSCIFCTHAGQPEILFETPALYAMPDKYPLLPGHVLIISRSHYRCHAEAPPEFHPELEEAAERVRRFLRDEYDAGALIWENGVFGQTVRHAHLHLIPIAHETFPAELDHLPAVSAVSSWKPVREHFATEGGYRYLALGRQRRLIAGRGVIPTIREWLAALTGLRHDGRDWCRETTPEDVADTARRWRKWQARLE